MRKIYGAIMGMDNTRFSRTHSEAEDKVTGLKKVNNVSDILKNKRGSDDQLTALFVALARASGLKAYLMTVVPRDRGIFNKSWLSYSQFDDLIAVVELDGKEQFFDPGQRFCPYGQLQWTHTGVLGLRQTEKDPVFAETPNGAYQDSLTKRIAALTVDSTGHESGQVKLEYSGARALQIRQSALKIDSRGLHKDLEDALKDELPDGSEVTLTVIDNLDEYEKPFTARFDIKGPLGVATTKRLILPGQLFQVKEHVVFPSENRETPVYFHFQERVADVVNLKFPEGWQVESQPASANFRLPIGVLYASSFEKSEGGVMLRREYIEATIIVLAKNYPELRDFYTRLATHDQEPLVLHSSGAVSH